MPHRRGRGALLAALALVAVTGCGGLDQTRLLGSDTGGALTTLGFGLPDEVASTRVDAFKAKYPDVDLRINEGAFDAQQFLSAVASGRPPDLVYLDREVLGSYAHRGALQPLTSCVDRAGIRVGGPGRQRDRDIADAADLHHRPALLRPGISTTGRTG